MAPGSNLQRISLDSVPAHSSGGESRGEVKTSAEDRKESLRIVSVRKNEKRYCPETGR
jgi:hypothetical protein